MESILGGTAGGALANAIREARSRKSSRFQAKQKRAAYNKAGYMGMINNARTQANNVANNVANNTANPVPQTFDPATMQMADPTMGAMGDVAERTSIPPQTFDPATMQMGAQAINEAELDPTGGAALAAPSNAAANLADPATRNFGVAGVAENMFGTPFQRQRSVSKKYCSKKK
jgi:hypothetical protein